MKLALVAPTGPEDAFFTEFLTGKQLEIRNILNSFTVDSSNDALQLTRFSSGLSKHGKY